MSDEVIRELWRIKDEIAREFNYDVGALGAYLRRRQEESGRPVVDLSRRGAGSKAEVLSQGLNPRVKEVTAEDDYRLRILFANGEVGVYDCRPLLDFGVFRELRDVNYFRQVRVQDGTVVWPHEQDICPDTLYLDSDRSAKAELEESKIGN